MATKKKQTSQVEPEEKIIDINLNPIKKQRYRINGDKILELNITDMNLLFRLDDSMPKLDELQKEVATLIDANTGNTDGPEFSDVAKALKSIDGKMRDIIDYIFDTNVSEVCVPSGNMFDLHNGMFTYEYIIEALGDLYEKTINDEIKARRLKMKKHTQKYGK